MTFPPEDIGLLGERAPAPPFLLGLRGAPHAAPENTLSGLRAALDLGLDGVQYDLRACAGGEPLLLADTTLDRTTDATGPVAERSLSELVEVDAGGWFARRFAGEPLALFEEALELGGDPGGEPVRHVVYVEDRELLHEVGERAREHGSRILLRVATGRRALALEARDSGLETLLLAHVADRELETFVRQERLPAVALRGADWPDAELARAWPCERWAWGVDAPDALLAACRAPLAGVVTSEPLRALTARALAHLVPDDEGPWPLRAPVLDVVPGTLSGGRGEWSGRWQLAARLRNPFPQRVAATVGLVVRRGAFEVEGLPRELELAPGEEAELPLRLAGGSWRAGGDPLLLAHVRWASGPGRRAGELVLETPLLRVRRAVADAIASRLTLLREGPRDPEASMTLRRDRRHLLVSIENDAGLADAHTLVHLDGVRYEGGRGVRAPLPPDFDHRAGGVPFSCGIRGRSAGGPERWVVRRWAGGVTEGYDAGEPGRVAAWARG